jgi:hypothetical protein
MAQRVQIQLIDDLNGQQAQETVRFGLDGADYEIDLTTENAEELRSTLGAYISNARRAGGRQSPKTAAVSPTSALRERREQTQQIRQWAKDNGHAVSSRGRINQSVMDAYNKAER